MKQTILLFTALLIGLASFAQDNAKFQNAMSSTLQKLSEAKDAEAYQAVANTFGRIAANEPGEWAPKYYQIFIKTFQAFDAKDKASVGAELDELMPSLDELLQSDNEKINKKVKSEIHTLLAMMGSARMMENPMVLGAKYAPINAAHLKKAIKLNKYNPRAYLLQAQSLFYTPESFGGDKAKAKQLAQKAMGLFSSGDPELPGAEWSKQFLPEWGRQQTQQLLDSMQPKEKE